MILIQIKIISIIISEVNDVFFINSSQNSIINMKNKSDNYESIKEIEPIIIDIPKLIRNKDSKSVQMHSLQLITPDINLNKTICNGELNKSNNTYKIDTKILSESDENFGLLDRNKHQKLSTLQTKYLKNQINESA